MHYKLLFQLEAVPGYPLVCQKGTQSVSIIISAWNSASLPTVPSLYEMFKCKQFFHAHLSHGSTRVCVHTHYKTHTFSLTYTYTLTSQKIKSSVATEQGTEILCSMPIFLIVWKQEQRSQTSPPHPRNQSQRKGKQKIYVLLAKSFLNRLFYSSFPWGRVALYSLLSFGTYCSHQALAVSLREAACIHKHMNIPSLARLWSHCLPLNPERFLGMESVMQLKCKVGEHRTDSDN